MKPHVTNITEYKEKLRKQHLFLEVSSKQAYEIKYDPKPLKIEVLNGRCLVLLIYL